MKPRRLAAVAALVLPLMACGPGGASFRFRVIVSCATPTGTRTSSGVFEDDLQKHFQFLPTVTPLTQDLHGQAVAVDTPGGTIFALPRGHEPGWNFVDQVLNALDAETCPVVVRQTSSGPVFEGVGGHARACDAFSQAKRLGGVFSRTYRGELPRAAWPLFVRFQDASRFASAEVVDPSSLGVTRITVETTRAPVTRGLQARLPWMSDAKAVDETVDGSFQGDPYEVRAYEFSQR